MVRKVHKDENSKDPRWQTPMEIEGVRPGDYNISMNTTGGGVQDRNYRKPAGAPAGSGPADPAGDNAGEVTPEMRKLARQRGNSG